MRYSKIIPATLAVSLALSGCSTLEGSERAGQAIGGVVGAVGVAALLVDHTGTIPALLLGVAGGIAGSHAGKRIARSVFERDLEARSVAYKRALSAYAQAGWRNPDTGSHGVITRTSDTWSVGDERCATFSEDYSAAGQQLNPLKTTNCLSARGWRAVA